MIEQCICVPYSSHSVDIGASLGPSASGAHTALWYSMRDAVSITPERKRHTRKTTLPDELTFFLRFKNGIYYLHDPRSRSIEPSIALRGGAPYSITLCDL